MTIQLELPPDVESRLAQQAAIAGQDVSAYVAQAVRQMLVVELNGSEAEETSYENWHEDFQTWLASHPSRNPDFDDSRESLYD